MAQITLNVNSPNFQALQNSFQLFNQSLNRVNSAGANINNQINLQNAVTHMSQMMAHMNHIINNSQRLTTQSANTSNHWRNIAFFTQKTAVNISEMTVSLLKWAGITSLIGGVVGIGGLTLGGIGIDRLAGSVATGRTTAMGRGTTWGKQAAFEVNFGRLGDAGGVLDRVSRAMRDPDFRAAFAGLNMKKWETEGDTADVAVRAYKHFFDLLKTMPRNAIANYMKAHHLDQMFTLDQALRAKDMGDEEKRKMFYGMRKDTRTRPGWRGKFGLSPQQQRKWQDFWTQLELAGKEIEKSLIIGLGNLTPGLKSLSAGISETIKNLLKEDGPVTHWLAEVNEALKWLASNITKKEFKDQVKEFFKGVESVAETLLKVGKSALDLLGWLSKLIGPSATTGSTAGGYVPSSLTGSEFSKGFTPHTSPGTTQNQSPLSSSATPGWWTADRQKHAYDYLTSHGISKLGAEALISRWVNVESTGGPGSFNPKDGGHWGFAQWSKNRAGDIWGNRDPDAQLGHVVKELKTEEFRAYNMLQNATTEEEAAQAASQYERGEGYNPTTGSDMWQSKTQRGMPRVHSIVSHVEVHNPVGASAPAAANAAVHQ